MGFSTMIAETIIENTDFEELLNNVDFEVFLLNQTSFTSRILKSSSRADKNSLGVNDLLDAFKFEQEFSNTHSFKLLYLVVKILFALGDLDL